MVWAEGDVSMKGCSFSGGTHPMVVFRAQNNDTLTVRDSHFASNSGPALERQQRPSDPDDWVGRIRVTDSTFTSINGDPSTEGVITIFDTDTLLVEGNDFNASDLSAVFVDDGYSGTAYDVDSGTSLTCIKGTCE